MTSPTAVMIRAGADWLKAVDDDKRIDPGYEELARGIWCAMADAAEVERGIRAQRWDDAVARELVGKGRLRAKR